MMILDHVMYELHYVTFQKFPAETMEHYGWLIYIRWVNFGPGWFLMSPLVRPGPPVPPLSLPLFRLRRLDEQKRGPPKSWGKQRETYGTFPYKWNINGCFNGKIVDSWGDFPSHGN